MLFDYFSFNLKVLFVWLAFGGFVMSSCVFFVIVMAERASEVTFKTKFKFAVEWFFYSFTLLLVTLFLASNL